MSERAGTPQRRRFRWTAFRWGVLAGLVVFVACAVLLKVAVDLGGPPAAFNVEVATAGADLGRLGARKLVVSREAGVVLTESCRGVCDDILYRAQSIGEDVYGVKVLDGSGDCLDCGHKQYVDNGMGSIAQWTISPDDKPKLDLRIRRTTRKDKQIESQAGG